MLTKRIIPCLDVKGGRVVKGKSFVQLRDAGAPEDLYKALVESKADAVLAASIFHYGTYSIDDIKQYLSQRGIPIRMQGG